MYPGKCIHIYKLSQVSDLLDSSGSDYNKSDDDPTFKISMCSKIEIDSSENPEGMVFNTCVTIGLF